MKKQRFFFATLILTACAAMMGCGDDNNETSKLPVFDKVTVTPSTASPGDTLTAKVTFSYSGSYIKGNYKYSTTPVALAGTFECGASQSSYSFIIIAPDSATTYELTIKPVTVAAYAGEKLFLDPAPMGTISTTFTVQ